MLTREGQYCEIHMFPFAASSVCRMVIAADKTFHNLVDPASSHMLASKIKPCMSKYKLLYGETANGSLKQLSSP